MRNQSKNLWDGKNHQKTSVRFGSGSAPLQCQGFNSALKACDEVRQWWFCLPHFFHLRISTGDDVFKPMMR